MADSFSYPTARIVVFSKAPRMGEVKTRLIPHLGAQAATELHARLLQQTINMVTSSKLAPVELWCSPDAVEPHFQSLQSQYHISLYNQHGINLGARMAHAATTVLARAEQLIIIGSDCPVMDKNYIDTALRALQSGSEVVIGPAEDGGYVLIGLNRFIPQVFENIAWGSDQVLQQTLAVIQHQAIQYQLLESLWDVDRLEDYQRYQEITP